MYPDRSPAANQPQRWPSVKSDVAVPFLQAAITAAVITPLLTIIVTAIFHTHTLKTATLIFSIAIVLAWLWRLSLITETLWAIERALDVDINRDGIRGRPPPAPIRLEIARENHQQFLDIEGLDDVQNLRHLAILALTNRLTERSTNQAFGWSREHWQQVRDQLIQRQLAQWNGPPGTTQGISLTKEGQETMRALLDQVS